MEEFPPLRWEEPRSVPILGGRPWGGEQRSGLNYVPHRSAWDRRVERENLAREIKPSLFGKDDLQELESAASKLEAALSRIPSATCRLASMAEQHEFGGNLAGRKIQTRRMTKAQRTTVLGSHMRQFTRTRGDLVAHVGYGSPRQALLMGLVSQPVRMRCVILGIVHGEFVVLVHCRH